MINASVRVYILYVYLKKFFRDKKFVRFHDEIFTDHQNEYF